MQRVIGLTLVVLQATLLGLLSRTVQFPVLVVLTASVGVVTKWRISLSRDQAFLLSAGAAFFFLLKHRFSPHEFPTGTEFIRTEVAFIIAQFLLAIEAAQFVIRHEKDRLSPVLPALGAVALICIADVQITNEQRPMTRAFAVAYPLLWAVYLWTCRERLHRPPTENEHQRTLRNRAQKRRRWMAGFTLAVIAVTAWFSSLGLYRLEKRIENWLVQMMIAPASSSHVGFARTARLGSIAEQKSEQEKAVALWTETSEFPGYLRGAVFTRFESSQWLSGEAALGNRVMAARNLPSNMRSLEDPEGLFWNPSQEFPENSDWRYLECWLARDQHSTAFTPLETTHLITAGEQVGALPFGTFMLYDFETCNPYTACVPLEVSPDEIPFREREAELKIPKEYRQLLEELANRIFANANTSEEKIRAVEDYFHQNYRYHLGIEVPAGEDPLLYFLREKPAAHCEYFATAAAMLLQTAGVPARYVTGFVPAEWNNSGGYWLARNRDAHAWVEAYVEFRGWVTVEATPAEGVPSVNQSSPQWAVMDGLRRDWKRLRVYLASSRWDRVGEVLTSSGLGYLIGFLFLMFMVYLAVRIRWPWLSRAEKDSLRDPAFVEMQKLLEQMDRQLKPHGLQRHPGETLHQFARRIEAWEDWQTSSRKQSDAGSRNNIPFAQLAAEWYHAYANARYQGSCHPQTVQHLRASWPSG